MRRLTQSHDANQADKLKVLSQLSPGGTGLMPLHMPVWRLFIAQKTQQQDMFTSDTMIHRGANKGYCTMT